MKPAGAQCHDNRRQFVDVEYQVDLVGHEVSPVWGTGAVYLDPFKQPGPQDNDVTAAMFLLLRTQDITSEVFTCPCSNAEKDTFEGHEPIQRSN